MAENKQGQQKSEPASQKRLQDERQKGQVAKSQDVTTAAMMLFGGMLVFVFGDPLFSNYKNFASKIFMYSTEYQITIQNVGAYFHTLLLFLSKILLPLLVLIFLISLAGEISQVGLKIAKKKFTEGLQFKKIFNPFSGLKKIFFSGRSWFELIKSIAKILVLGGVVYWVLGSKAEEIIGILERPFMDIGSFMVSVAFELVLKVGLIYVLIAVADWIYQKYRFAEDMKMTKQEVKEEHKQMEGDPLVKSRLRNIMRQRIRNLMLKNVQEADVVITNPTHFAVALSYKQGIMDAPKLVAKGADHLARQIREIAGDSGVPIVEEPPLARTLFYSVEVDSEIPEDLFKAVAQILAYVYQLKNYSSA